MYQIDLTARDVLGNRNDDPATWRHWRGAIDTLAPRVAITLTYSETGSTAKTQYEGVAEDWNLTTTDFSSPCDLQPSGYTYERERLVRLTTSCTVDGWQKAPVILRACDLFDRCVAAYPSQEYVYWTAMSWVRPLEGQVRRAPLAGAHTTADDVQILLDGRDRPFGVALDVAAGQFYWAEMGAGSDTGAIWRANLDGSDSTMLLGGLPVPAVEAHSAPPGRNSQRMGLALDSNANQMYWTQTATGEIWRANLDGSGATMLVDVWDVAPNNPKLFWLTLDLSHGKMYWLQGRNASIYAHQIWMANLDGSSPTKIYDDPDSAFLDGVVVNAESGTLFWTEADHVDNNKGTIWTAGLDGTNPTALLSNLATVGDITLLPDNGQMIWVAGPNLFEEDDGKVAFLS